MANPIPFVREIDIDYGRCDELSPLIRRVTANNPGPFTYLGTGTYIIGRGDVAVIDPGPIDDAHLTAILAATEGERITHIPITHTHNDHSPLAAALKEKTGAKTCGFGPHGSGRPEGPQMEEGGDRGFVPDIALKDGDEVSGRGWTLSAVHTPGHTSNHMCFALKEENALFCGDHIMGWSTTVIVPPDGDMTAYMNSLRKIRDSNYETLWPTHGPPVRDVADFIGAYIAHRQAREDQIVACLKDGIGDIGAMVKRMYADVDERLHPAAAMSVRAHMKKLIDEARVREAGSLYQLNE